MQITKTFALNALIAASAVLAAAPALANFPEKTVTIVVPTAAGGGNDAMARVVGQAMAAKLKQSFVVDNKAGANGSIASEFVARAVPDGYTLMLGYIATHAMNPSLQKLRYDPVKDFEPIGMLGSSATLMVVNPTVKAGKAPEVVALAKATPNGINYASAGNGTAPHFAAEMFKLATGAPLLHVPYKGSAPALNDTIGGQTQVMFPSLFSSVPYVKAGRLKAVGVAGPKRSPLLPDVPTLKEQGVDVDVSQWYALFAPAKTPKAIVDQLNKTLNEVLADPAVVKRLEEHGLEVNRMSPDQLRTYVQDEQVKWKKVVQAAKLTAD